MALADEQLDEVAEVVAELFPKHSGRHERVLAGLLLKLFGHSANNVSVLHGSLHFGSDSTATSGGTDEKLHETQESSVTIAFVAVDPIIHRLLKGCFAIANDEVETRLVFGKDVSHRFARATTANNIFGAKIASCDPSGSHDSGGSAWRTPTGSSADVTPTDTTTSSARPASARRDDGVLDGRSTFATIVLSSFGHH